ncbi:MAG: AAA family ATPase [Planctomycetales bacterium]|nr:AAA family ATPase [Planctomycetales bacterium]
MSESIAESKEGLLAAILAEESYVPTEPNSLSDLGLPVSIIEELICKRMQLVGMTTGRKLAEQLCLPFRLLESVYQTLRGRQIMVHTGSAPFNDYTYTLTEHGRERAQAAFDACAYSGPAPVPLMDYVLSVEAQSIRGETPKRDDLRAAFRGISVDEELFATLGPAVNSGAGLFLYGEPGNGKTTLAKRVTMCFGQKIWIPHALYEDGQIIKLYDAAYHEADTTDEDSLIKASAFDTRWVKIRRPTVVVGGELTLDNLEIGHNTVANVSEASLQMKSNCGCLLIDDFGRQRVDPLELLNRWIVPLESRVDYLTLATGKKIQVPFEQLIIFSTNLEPKDLVDDAFLRRIPYKIEVADPKADEFHRLFQLTAAQMKCKYDRDAVEYLLQRHYYPYNRSLRRCHPRDLMNQIRNYCVYNDQPVTMQRQLFDIVVSSYFTAVLPNKPPVTAATPRARKQPVSGQQPQQTRPPQPPSCTIPTPISGPSPDVTSPVPINPVPGNPAGHSS